MTLLALTPFQEILSRWSKQSAIPVDIPPLDELLGGILPFSLHAVVGESGVGKTWFCLKVISEILKKQPKSLVLYVDFGGNFRITNLKKVLPSVNQLDQITIFQPKTLLESILFFQNLLESSRYNYDLIIVDSIFGPPLLALEYLQVKKIFWEHRIFSHLFTLYCIVSKFKIPILLSNHLVSAKENSESISSISQYGGYLLEQFVPIEFIIQKTEHRHFLEVRIFQKRVGCSEFVLIP